MTADEPVAISTARIEALSDGVFAIAMTLLMFVSLLPFSTAMLGAFKLRQPVSLAIYFGNQLALGLTLRCSRSGVRRSAWRAGSMFRTPTWP